jgi:hypothetical protein
MQRPEPAAANAANRCAVPGENCTAPTMTWKSRNRASGLKRRRSGDEEKHRRVVGENLRDHHATFETA